MNNEQAKAWANNTVQRLITENLSERARVDVMKTGAMTETLLGFYRGYRNEVYSMEMDFDQAIQHLELSKGQRAKLLDMMTAALKNMLRNFKEFEEILNAQLSLINKLDEKKQEFLNQLDEQIYDEQELMEMIYEEVVRKGKRMVNVNRLLQKQKAA